MSPAKLSLSVDAIPQEKRAIYDKEPILAARDLRINFGRVVGLDGVNLDLYAGEVLAVIGDNGAGKSTLIKCLTGAYQHDSGQLYLNGQEVSFKRPQDAREAGIETVYQQLAVIPALDIASNLYLAREERRAGPLGSVLRMLDKKGMAKRAGAAVQELGIQTIQNMGQAVETLSGGQRQAVAVARAAAFGSKVVVHRLTGEACPFVEQSRVGGANQRTQPLDDVLQAVAVHVLGQRSVEGAPHVGEVAQHQALAAFQTVAAHEGGEGVTALQHLADE